MARSGPLRMSAQRTLSGEKRTSRGNPISVENDPTRTVTDLNGLTVGCDNPAGDVGGVASQVEHTDVDPDVRLLLLSQSGRYKRQGGMEAPPNCGVSRVLECPRA